MNILSLFDGISCGQVALNRSKILYNNYYASEINKNAIKVTMFNFPNTIQLGDVENFKNWKLPKIHLLIGGSPCQDLSILGKKKGIIKGEKSKLFFYYVKLLRKLKPRFFLYENVASMKRIDKLIISQMLRVVPLKINSALVSAQSRNRLYWTNIKGIQQPKDESIEFKDIIENGYVDRKKAICILESDSRPHYNRLKLYSRYVGKGHCTNIIFERKDRNGRDIRNPTQQELEKLQTLPVGYTQVLKRDNAASCIGNGWTISVISHIFNYMKKEIDLEFEDMIK